MLFCFCFFISFFAFSGINAQVYSSSPSASFTNAQVNFQNEIGANAHLYTGKEYTGYNMKITGDPYFTSSQMQNGDLFYNGSLYQNIPLLFDAFRQQIVINSFNQNYKIQLLNEKLRYFTLAGHRFENITVAEGKGENMGSGLFDIAFNGSASVLVKRARRILKGLRADEQDKFIEADEFYIRNGKGVYPVDNKNSVLQALNDKRDLIKIYIRQNKFSFKKSFEKELIATVTYYSTLNK